MKRTGIFLSLSLATLTLSISATAKATEIVGTQVGTLWAGASDSVWVLLLSGGTVIGTPPICNNQNGYALDMTTVEGQTMAHLLYSAKISGTTITVFGTGTCSIQENVESINTIKF